MLTSVDKMFIRFIFAKDMQLHYIWYYKILIKNSSCYPCGQFLISLCFPLQFILHFYLDFFLKKKLSCVAGSPRVTGIRPTLPPAVKALRWKFPLFSWLLLHVAAVPRSSCGGSDPAAGAAEPAVLGESNATDTPRTDVDSKETPAMDASSESPVALLALS